MATHKLSDKTFGQHVHRIAYQPGAMHVGDVLEHLYVGEQPPVGSNAYLRGEVVKIDADDGHAYVRLLEPLPET